MIDARWLMLGSIVMDTQSKELYEVIGVNSSWIETRLLALVKSRCSLATHDPNDLSPVPLTREVLEACEGYTETSWGCLIGDVGEDVDCTVSLCLDEYSGDRYELHSGAWMLSLHELQTLYSALYARELYVDRDKLRQVINNQSQIIQ